MKVFQSLFRFRQFSTKIADNSLKMCSNFKYPSVERDETIVEDYFGNKIKDQYRWLESPDSLKTKEFVKAQNDITIPFLEDCESKEKIRQKITDLWNYPKASEPHKHGSYYFQYRNTGLQNQSVIFKMEKLHSDGEVFFDPNALSPDGTIALQASKFSKDGRIFAYGLSKSGSDWIEIKFKNVETGNDYQETLKKVRYSSLTWMHDNIGFFYGGYLDQTSSEGTETDSSENQKLYYHQLGNNQSEDIVVAKFEDPHLRIGAEVSDCGNYIVITPIKGCKNNLLYMGKVDTGVISGVIPLIPIVEEFNADYEYITNDGEIFYFKTNRNAPNYHIIAIDLNNPSESNWRVVIPEHEKDVIDDASTINSKYFVISKLHDVKHILNLYEISTGKLVHEFKLDVGSIVSISGEREHTQMFFSFCSFLTPSIIHQVDFTPSGEIKEQIYHETKVGDFNRNEYETKQIFYKSKDGKQIPMFIINRKGVLDNLNGDTPTWLYGYGGFNISLTPFFGISKLIFVNNFKGIFALANIRGGGEYGNKWHDGGRFENKQNCFDDFQHAAKYLIENKYTNSKKLVIQGGSNGGLLVAACINQAPELFGAAICQVGVLDMLRYHKFTIGHAWKSDYGCSDEEEQFKYLIKYSPLHNIFEPNEKKQYPATLLLTADHDDRVVPLHSLKFIAELQRKAGNSPYQKNPLLIRLETKAGHGGGKPTSKIIDELTDIFCFVSKTLNIPFYN